MRGKWRRFCWAYLNEEGGTFEDIEISSCEIVFVVGGVDFGTADRVSLGQGVSAVVLFSHLAIGY